MKKTAVILMVITVFTQIVGFAREITLSYFFGASNVSDAYLIALTIPLTVFTFIGTGIASSYIPMYTKVEKETSTALADRFTSNVVHFTLLVSTLVVILVLFFTAPIVKLFASGFTGETLNLTVSFTRISILGIYFLSLIFVFNGYLQMKNGFVITAITLIPRNLVAIASIVLGSMYNLIILPIGSVLAAAVQFLLLLPSIYKKGYRYTLVLDRNDEYLRNMILLSLPVIIGVSVNQINVLIDRTLASQIVIGGISALTYANRLSLFIQGIFVLSIVTAMYPSISKMAAENNISGLRKSITEGINIINLLVLPATVGAMVFSEPIVNLLFGRGAFENQAIIMTSSALFYYSIGMVGVGLREVLSRAFYSLQDTKTPMVNAAIAMVLNIILNFILSKYLGIGGLALATSIAAIFTSLLLFIQLRKKLSPFGMKGIAITFIKLISASVIMGLTGNFVYERLIETISLNIALFLAIGICAVVYFVLVYFMKIEGIETIGQAIKGKLKK